MDFPRTPLLCGLELFLFVWNNKAACVSFTDFYIAFHLLLLHLGQMSGFLSLTAVLSALQRRAQTGIGADVRKDMAMPFKNVVYTQTDTDTQTWTHTHTHTF